MIVRRALAALAIISALCSCSSSKPHGKVTDKQARQVLEAVIAATGDPNSLCDELALDRLACRSQLQYAEQACLNPGLHPRVIDSAAIPDKKGMQGGRLLVLDGRTLKGAHYRTEMFIAFDGEVPKASTITYWTGMRYAGSPFGGRNAVFPEPECRLR